MYRGKWAGRVISSRERWNQPPQRQRQRKVFEARSWPGTMERRSPCRYDHYVMCGIGDACACILGFFIFFSCGRERGVKDCRAKASTYRCYHKIPLHFGSLSLFCCLMRIELRQATRALHWIDKGSGLCRVFQQQTTFTCGKINSMMGGPALLVRMSGRGHLRKPNFGRPSHFPITSPSH